METPIPHPPLNEETWAAVVGQELAQHSRPIELAGVPADALVIEAENNAWAQQLGFLSDRIMREVQARGINASRIRIRVASRKP